MKIKELIQKDGVESNPDIYNSTDHFSIRQQRYLNFSINFNKTVK